MSLKTYLRESVTELHKVAWPTRAQAVRIATIVLGFTLVSAAIFGAFDSILTWAYAELVRLATTIAG